MLLCFVVVCSGLLVCLSVCVFDCLSCLFVLFVWVCFVMRCCVECYCLFVCVFVCLFGCVVLLRVGVFLVWLVWFVL